jgi:hypothetical protein
MSGPDEGTGSGRRRYRVEQRDDGRVVLSGNAPNIALHIERGLTIDSRGRKRYGPRTIFLDGVYDGAPFLDNEAKQYSLDHHAGCVRGFTVATCEQAVVVLLQGLPLSSGMWDVYINDPDLDSMLAAWVLFNHIELLKNDRALLAVAMPLIRLEGVIDAHGIDKQILAAMPDAQVKATKARLDKLMAEERRLKTAGKWMTCDWHAYACQTFDAVDQLVFPDQTLDKLLELQERGRAALANDRVALLLDSALGIYEVESRLKERLGDNLGVIVLKTGDHRYTLRLVDAFLPKDLTAVYKALNKADPNASRGAEPNQWGGSSDIGGAPRKAGTGLSEPEILAILGRVLGPRPSLMSRLLSLFARRRRQPALPPPR